MTETHTGTCLCGAVAIEATGAPLAIGYCHCQSCRHYSGAPLHALNLWRREDVRVVRGAEFLGRYDKTQTSHRRFCRRCGGHVMVDHPRLGFTDIYAALLRRLAFEVKAGAAGRVMAR